jgi:hypothetical protein
MLKMLSELLLKNKNQMKVLVIIIILCLVWQIGWHGPYWKVKIWKQKKIFFGLRV